MNRMPGILNLVNQMPALRPDEAKLANQPAGLTALQDAMCTLVQTKLEYADAHKDDPCFENGVDPDKFPSELSDGLTNAGLAELKATLTSIPHDALVDLLVRGYNLQAAVFTQTMVEHDVPPFLHVAVLRKVQVDRGSVVGF